MSTPWTVFFFGEPALKIQLSVLI